jgi:hypothetical protein
MLKLSFKLLIILFFFISCTDERLSVNIHDSGNIISDVDTNSVITTSAEAGIFINISADAFTMLSKNSKNIGVMSKEEAINTLNNYIDSFCPTGNQVTALIYNVNYQRSCFDNQVMESFWDFPNPDKNITGWPKTFWQIEQKGIDIYDLCIKRTRERHISPWLSVRMNDHHYFNDTSKINRFWIKNPKLRLDKSMMFDFENKEVRDYFKAYINECLKRFDIDGIELDWMRTYKVFKPGRERIAGVKLDEFMAEIRSLVQSYAKERGHSIKISVRLPYSPSLSESFGLNGVNWARRNLIDVLVPCNWYRPTNFNIPIEDWKSKIGVTNCLILSGADQAVSISTDKYAKNMVATAEWLRGFAIGAYNRGSDGIYLFNNFGENWYRYAMIAGKPKVIDDKPIVLSEIGRISTIVKKPRSFVYTFAHPDFNQTDIGIDVPIKNLITGQENLFKMNLGNIVGNSKYVVRVGIDQSATASVAQLTVNVNGISTEQLSDLPKSSPYSFDNTKNYQDIWDVSLAAYKIKQFSISNQGLVNGYNYISIRNENLTTERLLWLEIYLEEY